jgi:hypothetical protein
MLVLQNIVQALDIIYNPLVTNEARIKAQEVFFFYILIILIKNFNKKITNVFLNIKSIAIQLRII